MRSPLRSALLALLAALAAVDASVDAQACAAGAPTQLGTATALAQACPSGPGSLPRTTCVAVRVTCDGLADRVAELRVTEPDPGVPLRGTVLLGTGGGGVGFYQERPGGPELFADLLARGYRLVDRKWNAPWFYGTAGMRKQSCRYATLLTWVHDNLHTTGRFCATGNSGGAGELAYALSAWGRGAILDVAVPSGGPPMARLDYICANPSSVTWNEMCSSVMPANVMECQAACSMSHSMCTSCVSGPTSADLHADSVLHPGAVVDYPNTRVHTIIGAQDCTAASRMAMLFYNSITSDKVLEFVPGTPHWTATTPEGRDAILRALLGAAACQTPVTLSARDWPRVGGVLDLDVRGAAGGAYLVFLSFDTTLLEVGTVGWLFLRGPVVNLGGGALDANGRATLSLPLPNAPKLAGLPLYDQALSGSCLTNVTRVEILP